MKQKKKRKRKKKKKKKKKKTKLGGRRRKKMKKKKKRRRRRRKKRRRIIKRRKTEKEEEQEGAHCIFLGFWPSAILASQILLCFPAFQGSNPKMVSKKARNLGSRNLKHYKIGISENTIKQREFLGDSCL